MNITRRTALAFMGAAAVPSATVAGVAMATSKSGGKATPSPEQEIERLVTELHLAMREMYGPCDLIRSEDLRMIVICPPPRARTVEFAGAGRYEVEDGSIRPIMFIERAPQRDHPRDGRCFKAVPEPGQLRTRYYYEGHLRTILVRKISGRLA